MAAMRKVIVAVGEPWGWLCGVGLLAASVTATATAAAQGAAPDPAKKAEASTVVRSGEETCADLARRVYGKAPEAVKLLASANPGLCDLKPLPVFATVRTPPLPKKKGPPGPPRLSFVGPAVRTKTPGGWMEALPGQAIDRKTRIETSSAGGPGRGRRGRRR